MAEAAPICIAVLQRIVCIKTILAHLKVCTLVHQINYDKIPHQRAEFRFRLTLNILLESEEGILAIK